MHNHAQKFNNETTKARILVAPLEWGLGHATRCIPIIKHLISRGAEVFIAAEGATFSLLKREFPDNQFLPLMGYRMRYSRKKYLLPLKILLQVPRIMYTIYRETQWLKKMIHDYKLNGVISDNRFGLYNKTIRAVYITHQLRIKTGNRFTENILQKIHYWYISKYDECWVPDFKNDDIAGELSHPHKVPSNVKYSGALSRFEKIITDIKYDLLVIISGPEPQRSIFEQLILKQLKDFEGNVLFIRGLPGGGSSVQRQTNIEIHDHLDANALNVAIEQSEVILGRAGYTTIMDLIKLRKKAILVPTPGQTEQEYLAKYLSDKGVFYGASQDEFSLQKAVNESADFAYDFPERGMEEYKSEVDAFLRSI